MRQQHRIGWPLTRYERHVARLPFSPDSQIDHLIAMSQRPRVTIQIIPASAKAYGGMSGAFAVADTHDETAAYLETGIMGMVVRDPKLVTRATSMFDYLKSDADPRARTQELLERAGEQWKTQAT